MGAWGHVPVPASSRAWQLLPCGSGFRVKDRKQGVIESPFVLGVSLSGGPERLLCEAVKEDPGGLGDLKFLNTPES